jgi:hypothetical protein
MAEDEGEEDFADDLEEEGEDGSDGFSSSDFLASGFLSSLSELLSEGVSNPALAIGGVEGDASVPALRSPLLWWLAISISDWCFRSSFLLRYCMTATIEPSNSSARTKTTAAATPITIPPWLGKPELELDETASGAVRLPVVATASPVVMSIVVRASVVAVELTASPVEFEAVPVEFVPARASVVTASVVATSVVTASVVTASVVNEPVV